LAETRRVILQHAACSDNSDFDGHKGVFLGWLMDEKSGGENAGHIRLSQDWKAVATMISADAHHRRP
jgi:hypothetical protein